MLRAQPPLLHAVMMRTCTLIGSGWVSLHRDRHRNHSCLLTQSHCESAQSATLKIRNLECPAPSSFYCVPCAHGVRVCEEYLCRIKQLLYSAADCFAQHVCFRLHRGRSALSFTFCLEVLCVVASWERSVKTLPPLCHSACPSHDRACC